MSVPIELVGLNTLVYIEQVSACPTNIRISAFLAVTPLSGHQNECTNRIGRVKYLSLLLHRYLLVPFLNNRLNFFSS